VSEDAPVLLAGFGPGSVLAGYRLEAQVGAGGFAVVFRAHDERLGRPVALKILAPGLAADPGFRRRFIAESRAAATVDDPHIIPVYEAGEADGVLFIAMRFIAGGDLRGVLDREGPLPPGRAAEFISPVASALDAAHRAGLVHRDVKPANILVDAGPDRPDHVYLSDFGVTKGAISSASVAGQFLGTPDYSAPEQIQGRAVDGRTDQYALACVAYQLLTGATPFERDQGMAVLLAHLSEPPPSLGAQLPVSADAVVARAMAKAPEQRYGSCREFADALREALGLTRYHGSAPARGKAATPAGVAADATVDSVPDGEQVRAPDLLKAAATAAEAARPAIETETWAVTPSATGAADKGISREPRPTSAPGVRPPGRRPRRLRLAIAIGCVVAAVAGTVPFLLASSPRSSSTSGGSSSSPDSAKPLTASAPGITVTTITIGSTRPLTGLAVSGGDEIGPASAAYFAYVNAHGGVYGRSIVYQYLGDPSPATSMAPEVRQLVLQDNVYAVFNGLGPAPDLAAASFLNSEKVPDVFAGSGCQCWDQPSVYPDTFGYQLDPVREGKILGQYVAHHFAGKKIGYFYEDDQFGTEGVEGLDDEIPGSMVVARQAYSISDNGANVASQVTALRAAGAQVVVAFSIPFYTALLKLTSLEDGYSPTLVVSNEGADPSTVAGLLDEFAKEGMMGKGGATVNGNALTSGIITDGYLPSVSDTSNSWIAMFKMIHDGYDALAPWDGSALYGEAVAYEFVQAMFLAGRNPTRADLVSAIDGGLPQGPAVAPFAYSSSDHDGVTGAYIGVIEHGVVVQEGPVLITDTSASGPVTTYTPSESQPSPVGQPV
jgi:branched-chain amino acid transport system substrate-binding protein